MKSYKTILLCWMIYVVFLAHLYPDTANAQWYAGTWDSTIYLLREHPRTVAIRMELLDKDTHNPVSDVHVSLEGEYFERWISQDIAIAQEAPWWGDIFVDPNKREPQPKEFKLEAVSDQDGVVVFSLQWQKEFPWDTKIGDKWTYSVNDKWLVYIDDIEKVQRLEIRHPRYKYIEAPLNFTHVSDPVYYVKASKDGEDRYKLFEKNWRNEIKRKNVKMFVLDLGDRFPEYKKQFCTRPEFFQKVRAKDYGTVYRDPNNLPNLTRGTECGPYFAYDLGEVLLERVAQQIEIGQQNNNILLGQNKDDSVAVKEKEEEATSRTEPYNQMKSPIGKTFIFTKVETTSQTKPSESDKVSASVTVREEDKKAKAEPRQPEQAKADDLQQLKVIAEQDAFGIAVETLTKEQRKEMGLPIGVQGVLIKYVLPGSYAEKAGLRTGQVIDAIRHRVVNTKEDYDEHTGRLAKGDQILISFWIQKRGKWEQNPVICYTYGSGQSRSVSQPLKTKYTCYTQWPFDAQEAKKRQIETAKTLGVPVEKTINMTNWAKMNLILIPAGEFMMGSPDSEKGIGREERPQHRVRITKGFYMGETEVTQEQYQAVMVVNSSYFKAYNLPVENVSWDDAVEFCRRLSQKEGRTYRLPTEAEWEYACRAGSATRFCYGDRDTSLVDYAWYGHNCYDTTHPVGQKKPNAFGLYDMHGNVFEWCNDWDDRDYYSQSPVDDPKGPSTGHYRVFRGGSWVDYPDECRVANRQCTSPTARANQLGFRLVLDLN